MSPESLLRPVDRAVQHLLRELNPAIAQEVLQLAALASWQVGQGHACLDLHQLPLRDDPALADIHRCTPEALASALDAEALVASSRAISPEALLVHDGRRLYLRRYHAYETSILRSITTRLAIPRDSAERLAPAIAALFPASTLRPDCQKIACAVAAGGRVGIITGGPGTGKTTTVVKVLGVLQSLAMAEGGAPLRIGLGAPTGKAAARLGESIGAQVAALDVAERIRAELPTRVRTVHRLLGRRRDSRLPKHDAASPLPYDVVIIDEASMLDLEMTARLLDALRPDARLILLGDKDQLASIEAGAVFGDLCRRAGDIGYSADMVAWIEQATGEKLAPAAHPGPALDQQIVMLRHSHRFGARSGIGQLAVAINAGDATAVTRILGEGWPDLGWLNPAEADRGTILDAIADGYAAYLQAMSSHRPGNLDEAAQFAWARDVLREYARFQLLVAVREGRYGAQAMNRRIEQALAGRGLIEVGESAWYPGRPVMVTENDYSTGLMNGDVGITLALPHPSGQGSVLRVAFPEAGDAQRPVRLYSPGRLLTVETVFAMTVHKAQGSEFDHAMCLLPPPDTGVMSRELLYTAATRAKHRFTLVGPIEVAKAAVRRTTQRASGLDADNEAT